MGAQTAEKKMATRSWSDLLGYFSFCPRVQSSWEKADKVRNEAMHLLLQEAKLELDEWEAHQLLAEEHALDLQQSKGKFSEAVQGEKALEPLKREQKIVLEGQVVEKLLTERDGEKHHSKRT